jgi:hypothetical protein
MTPKNRSSFATHYLLPSVPCRTVNRSLSHAMLAAALCLLRPASCLLPSVSCLLLSVFCLLPSVAAQSATATLSGTVLDEKDAVIPGATVVVVNTGTGARRQTTTNEEGSFIIPLLPPSTYVVNVQQQGFAPVEVPNVVLNVGDQKSLQIHLKVGNLSEMVQVNSDTPLINESPTVATVVDRQFVENIPLNGRSFQTLIQLTPGAVLTKTNPNEQGQFSVNGQRADANYFTVDGVSANISVNASASLGQQGGGSLPGLSATGGTNSLVSVDALQEFRIQTSTYAPEFGRTPGAQVSIITRSGTNEFHGTGFEYFRNDKMDANDWFANRSGLKKPPLRQNDFGFVLGGPILLPRFGEGGHQPAYNGRNRTFFFFSYEGLRLRQPQVLITDVPSLAARQNAPDTFKPFLNAFPLPTGPANANNFAEFAASFSNPSTLNATSLRIDHTINNKLVLFGRYNDSPSTSIQRGGTRSLNTLNKLALKIQTVTAGATATLTPSVSNDLRFNYSRSEGSGLFLLDSFGGAVPPPDSLFFPSPFTTQDSQFGLALNGGRNSSIAVGSIATNLQRQFNLVDSLSFLLGDHQLKFGVDYRRLSPVFGPRNYAPFVNITGVPVTAPVRASIVIITNQSGPLFPLFTNLSAFAQDTWKAARRLTLTYGIRWELNPPPSEKKGKDAATVIGLDTPSTMTLAPPGTPLWKDSHNNFAPRVGVSYLLSKTSGKETVLRGGLGIFYDLGIGQAANAFSNTYPFASRKQLSNVAFPLDPLSAAPLPLPPSLPIAFLVVFDPNHKLPRIYQWNLAVEQSLGANQTISASYVAAVGRDLLRQEQYSGALLAGNPLFAMGSVQVIRNAASSDYHAMQLQFHRRLANRMQALASYTWSHSIDNISNDSSTSNTLATLFDPNEDRGPSDFDVRHSFTGAITYNIPAPP